MLWQLWIYQWCKKHWRKANIQIAWIRGNRRRKLTRRETTRGRGGRRGRTEKTGKLTRRFEQVLGPFLLFTNVLKKIFLKVTNFII